MFRLELHQLLFAYTGLCLGVVLLAWWLHNMRRGRRERIALHNLLRCRLCGFEFRDTTGEATPACPRCGGLVSRERLSRL